jgi:hypothetical protein
VYDFGMWWRPTDKKFFLFCMGLQEFGAVVFNLFCGSRLGDHDYYYAVTKTGSQYSKATDASYISNASLSSMFVLFITLHVFNGPYLNLWLVSLDYVCVHPKIKDNADPIYTKAFRLFVIAASHFTAVAFAFAVIPPSRLQADYTIEWPNFSSNVNEDVNYWAILVEELFAVVSLLVGFLYLAWLRPKPLKIEPPRVDFDFFIRLTFVVTACKRAFPTAHLSPHVSTYLVMTGQIHIKEWASRFFMGVIASIVVILWDQNFRNRESNDDIDQDDPLVPLIRTIIAEQLKLPGQTNTRPRSAGRVYSNGTDEPVPAAGGGIGDETLAQYRPGSSLSISFAKPGIYF